MIGEPLERIGGYLGVIIPSVQGGSGTLSWKTLVTVSAVVQRGLSGDLGLFANPLVLLGDLMLFKPWITSLPIEQDNLTRSGERLDALISGKREGIGRYVLLGLGTGSGEVSCQARQQKRRAGYSIVHRYEYRV